MNDIIIDSETMEVVDTKKDAMFQNRDVTKWMDRIESGKKHMDEATDILDIVGRIVSDAASEAFKQQWRNNYESHENPVGLSLDTDIKAPIVKKEHDEGDKDEFFIYYKEYPYYYVWNVFDVFTVQPSDDRMKKMPDYFKEWFTAVISEKLEKDILKMLKAKLSPKYESLFAFPTCRNEFQKKKINIVFSSSFAVATPSSKRGNTALFKSSSDYANMIKNELAIAIGRIIDDGEAKTEEKAAQ